MSFIERAQKESEELVRTMGGSLELEGGRRTRSSARGTPNRSTDVTPPPAKKARNSPTTPRGRGRGRKSETPVAATETSSIDEEKVLSPVEHNKAETTPKNRKRKKSDNESEDIPPVDHVDNAKTEDIPVITIEAAKDVTKENNIDHATEGEKEKDEDIKEEKEPEEKQEQTPKITEEPPKTVAIVAANEITINENKDAVREENNEVLEKKEEPIEEAMEVDNESSINTNETANEPEEKITEQKEDDLSTKAEFTENSAEQQKDVVVPAAQNEITSSLSHSENEENTAKNGVVHDDATTKLADLPISDGCTNNNDNDIAEKATSDLPSGDYVKTPTEISEIKHANNLVAADGGGEPTTVIAVTSCNN